MSAEMSARGPIGASTKFSLGGQFSGSVNAGSAVDAAGDTGGDESPSPVTVLIGIFILIALFKFIGESPDTKIEGAHIHVGAYNLGTILLVSIGGTAVLKLIFNKFQLPGITSLLNFV